MNAQENMTVPVNNPFGSVGLAGGTFGGGIANALAPKPTQSPQITSEIQRLEKAIADLQQAMGEHLNRLEPCLQPETGGHPASSPEKETLVPLAARIRDSREKIETMTVCLRYTTNSIQF